MAISTAFYHSRRRFSEVILPNPKPNTRNGLVSSPSIFRLARWWRNPRRILTETLILESDAVRLNQTTADNITIRKNFSFPRPREKDNDLVELDIDLQNGLETVVQTWLLSCPWFQRSDPSNDVPLTLVCLVRGGESKVALTVCLPPQRFGEGPRLARPLYQRTLLTRNGLPVSNQFFYDAYTPLTRESQRRVGTSVEYRSVARGKIRHEGALASSLIRVAPVKPIAHGFKCGSVRNLSRLARRTRRSGDHDFGNSN